MNASRQVEQTIEEYTVITDQYMLAMPSVSVEGADYTANAITQPERFHMLQGQTGNGVFDTFMRYVKTH